MRNSKLQLKIKNYLSKLFMQGLLFRDSQTDYKYWFVIRPLIFSLIAAVVIFLIIISQEQKSVPVSQEQINKGKPFTQTGGKVFEQKENSEGEVTVTVKPLKLDRGRNTVFEVTMETHTVELDKDLKEVSILMDDKGKEYKPISWSGGLGGHHISGDLVFSPLLKDAKSAKLVIKGIDGIDRNFEWKLF